MIKRTLSIILCIYLSTNVFAQKSIRIDLVQSGNKSLQQEKIRITNSGIELKESLSFIELNKEETKEGSFVSITSEDMLKSYDVGYPNLPVIGKLIEIPQNSKAIVKILSFDEEIIKLNEHSFSDKIIPAQPSLSKSDDPKEMPFYKNADIYNKNEFYKKDIVKIEDRGYMRNVHLGYVEISPFEYNPVTNTLKVLNNIEYEISFVSNNEKPAKNLSSLESPYFNNIVNTINKTSSSKALISDPIKYVIVSDRMFEETLQPFIEWKTMKGFNVIESYTDEPSVGSSTTSIKAYLKDLYENPTDGVSPTFVLLVGDVAQIPAFDHQVGSDEHVTDLYYFEYTGDKLPEVFYGRFSATTVGQLQPQIDKTLEVEKYEMPDPSYLDNVVLVAGVDAGAAPTFGNGFVNYANQYYTNAENGITSYYYLYNDDSGVMSSNNSGASASIQSYISAGVSIANYTAHCGPTGWSDPSFSNSDVADMTNEHKYPLMIGNCCQSVKFEDSSFGEEVLRASGKGAVGYIGGSDFSYWDEDFHWGIGLEAISANPTYNSEHLGSYDRFFHLNGEAKSDWFVTQGQMVVAGNLAVEASSSSRKAYYWEIYHLMGDPSLTPYVTVPEVLTATYNPDIVIGEASFTVNTEENAYVAVSFNGELLDAKLVGASGLAELTFEALSNVGELDLVITKQNKQPKIDKVNIVATTTPYVVLDTYTINDTEGNGNSEVDYSESVKLNVTVKNVADVYDALLVNATLSSTNNKVTITKTAQSYETVEKATSKLINDAFSIDFGNNFEDQENVEFLLTVVGENNSGTEYTWESKLNIKVNAPKLQINDFVIDDSNHNNDGTLDPGETGNIRLTVENKGHAAISGVKAKATLLGNGSDFLTLNSSEVTSLTINNQDVLVIDFNASVGSEVANGEFLDILFDINDVADEIYGISDVKELVIGVVENILISQQGTVTTKNVNFYDTGGAENSYSNNESYVITFLPEAEGKSIQANFLSFNVESHESCNYDKLDVYNGTTTSSHHIGTYCGAQSIGKILATNSEGALTFVFTSDVGVVESGWEAQIRSFEGKNYHLTVKNSEGVLEGASVEIQGQTKTTGLDGVVLFENIVEGINFPVVISAPGYATVNKTIDLLEDVSEEIILEKITYQVIFKVKSTESNLPIENALISFMGENVNTDESGSYIFENLEYGIGKIYSVTKNEYKDYQNQIDVSSNKTVSINLDTLSYEVTFIVLDQNSYAMRDVLVNFNSKEIKTDSQGKALFTEVLPENDMNYIIEKTGYTDIQGSINVDSDVTITKGMSLATGVNNLKEEDINIYPNPSSGVFNIEIPNLNESKNYTIKIYDILGSVVYSKSFAGERNILEQIDISNKTKGIYFISVDADHKSILNQKIIIK